MYNGQIRAIVTLIILVGHFLVFLFGGLLGFFGPLQGTDLAQVVLTASPVMAVTAVGAFRFIMDQGQYGIEKGDKVGALFAGMVVVTPLLLLLCVLGLFYATYRTINGFGIDELKLSLGAVETFFGVFIGMISDRLFGRSGAADV